MTRQEQLSKLEKRLAELDNQLFALWNKGDHSPKLLQRATALQHCVNQLKWELRMVEKNRG